MGEFEIKCEIECQRVSVFNRVSERNKRREVGEKDEGKIG